MQKLKSLGALMMLVGWQEAL